MVSITHAQYGKLPDSTHITQYTLQNTNGITVSVINYGCIITSVKTPDRNGEISEITLGYNTLQSYLDGHPYFGALVGRVAGRISEGGFSLDNTWYSLPANADEVHLHGGHQGFDKHVWKAEQIRSSQEAGIRFTRLSPDREEGYPGNLQVTHTLILTDDNTLRMDFEAETDAPTIINLTNHAYWKLSAEPTILDHELLLYADSYAAAHKTLLPTGSFVPVQESNYDFTQWRAIRSGFEVLTQHNIDGYDFSFCVNNCDMQTLRPAAALRSPASGRMMTIHTTYPDVHFYSGNFLQGTKARSGQSLAAQAALCLECQYFPNAPHHPNFPSIVLRPKETYRHCTRHTFSVYE